MTAQHESGLPAQKLSALASRLACERERRLRSGMVGTAHNVAARWKWSRAAENRPRHHRKGNARSSRQGACELGLRDVACELLNGAPPDS